MTTLTARGRTWAILAGVGAVAFTAAALASLAPDLTDLRSTADRVYGAATAGDLVPLYRADPDCDGLDLAGRVLDGDSGIGFEVTDVDVAGNHGAVDVTTTGLGAPIYGVAQWQLSPSGAWRLAADGNC